MDYRQPRPLLRAAIELLNAVNGLRALSRRGYAMLLAFPSGWPTSELPVVVLGASLFDVLRRARRGHFRGLRGVAALALTVAAWLVLVVIRRHGVTMPGPVLHDALVDRGFVCVSLGYRVSPRNSWPDHIVDVKRGLAWVKNNIAAYAGDPDFVAITGGSAGGHLAALAALTPGHPGF